MTRIQIALLLSIYSIQADTINHAATPVLNQNTHDNQTKDNDKSKQDSKSTDSELILDELKAISESLKTIASYSKAETSPANLKEYSKFVLKGKNPFINSAISLIGISILGFMLYTLSQTAKRYMIASYAAKQDTTYNLNTAILTPDVRTILEEAVNQITKENRGDEPSLLNRCLFFTGESGIGKSYSASILANTLGKDTKVLNYEGELRTIHPMISFMDRIKSARQLFPNDYLIALFDECPSPLTWNPTQLLPHEKEAFEYFKASIGGIDIWPKTIFIFTCNGKYTVGQSEEGKKLHYFNGKPICDSIASRFKIMQFKAPGEEIKKQHAIKHGITNKEHIQALIKETDMRKLMNAIKNYNPNTFTTANT